MGDPGDGQRRPLQPMAWLRAMRRHWIVAGGSFALTVALAAVVLTRLPRTYHVQTQLVARRQQVLPSLARPSLGDESPTAGAFELVHRRDNLAALLRETGVLAAESRAVRKPGAERLSEEELLRILIKRLDAALVVTPGDGTLTLSIDWRNPKEAYELVTAAARNYLDARKLAETQPIEEAIGTLEGRAAQLRANVDTLLAEAQRHRPTQNRRPPPAPEESAAPAAQLEAAIRSKRQSIRDAEDLRRRKLTELQGKLSQEEAVYGPGYPSQISLKQEIAVLSQPAPQVVALREEVREAETEFRRRFGRFPGKSEDPGAADSLDFASQREPPPDSPEARFKQANLEYQAMLDRISGARIELETARAAFKYRYNVIWPAELPKKPDHPKVASLFAASVVAGLFLSLCLALGADALSGRIVERAQVEHKLRLPILGELGPLR